MNKANDSIQTFESANIKSHEKILMAIERLGDNLQQIPKLCADDGGTSNAAYGAILELLTQRLPEKPQKSATKGLEQNSLPIRAIDTSGNSEANPQISQDVGDNDGLQQALDRLRHLAEENERTAFGEDAETILADVDYVYDLLLKPEKEEHLGTSKGKRAREDFESDITEDQMLQRREMKRVKNFIKASQSIAINEKGVYVLHSYDSIICNNRPKTFDTNVPLFKN